MSGDKAKEIASRIFLMQRNQLVSVQQSLFLITDKKAKTFLQKAIDRRDEELTASAKKMMISPSELKEGET